MATITFDTLKYAQQLRSSGVPGEQAEAFARAHAEAMAEAAGSTLATKMDVAELKAELRVIQWMVGVILLVTVIPVLKDLFLGH
ncbi:MAG: DUF1640 domain-containing protein [Magnetococcales bacterium]|nr:DUF1640 domain-containing protein [Magnetococcales bacterium]MBF0157138.1 DUF1640 domain-containing protein [Magnetococcales bacterium]